MKYEIVFKPRAAKDLRAINADDVRKILAKVRGMENDLIGDVYRLRVGNYRVLFNVTNDLIIIYRIKHRREAY